MIDAGKTPADLLQGQKLSRKALRERGSELRGQLWPMVYHLISSFRKPQAVQQVLQGSPQSTTRVVRASKQIHGESL